MKMFTLAQEIRTFGREVGAFPAGIAAAFGELIADTGDRAGERDYFGVSTFRDGRMHYYALAAERQAKEAERPGYEKIVIPAGRYLVRELPDWQANTGCIRDIFMEMLQDPSADRQMPAIEWYRDDQDMWCMLYAREQL